MMKFSVPVNWRDDLFDILKEGPVDELYGKMDRDAIGGGRPSFMLARARKSDIERQIKKTHKHGLRFNYLLNATCIGNREMTAWGQRRLKSILDWLVNNDVDAVTVSIPYLLEYIKRRYPRLKTYVSTMAGVDSVERAKYWESLGADRITVSAVSNVIRDFTRLCAIRKNIGCELQLIVNLICLRDCPFWTYHSAAHSHASQDHHRSRGFLIDYCFLLCNYLKLKDPTEIIRSGWIRPEDLDRYEKIGFNRIKFANRDMSTDATARLIISYAKRRYEGNLLDLFSDKSKLGSVRSRYRGIKNKLRYFLRPRDINIFKLSKLGDLLEDSWAYLDNRTMDDFLEHFVNADCDSKDCKRCGYCRQIAEKALKVADNKRIDLMNKYRDALEDVASGSMFRYF